MNLYITLLATILILKIFKQIKCKKRIIIKRRIKKREYVIISKSLNTQKFQRAYKRVENNIYIFIYKYYLFYLY